MERIRYETEEEARFEPYDHVGTWSGAAAGAVMGALGGLAMIALPMFTSYVTNNGAFTPLRIIGTVGNARITDIGTPTVIWGFCLLMGTCSSLGALFGALANRQGRTGGSLPFGVGYAWLSLLAIVYGVLPTFHQNLYNYVKGAPATWFIGTFIWGLFVGMAPILAFWGRRRYHYEYDATPTDVLVESKAPTTVIVEETVIEERVITPSAPAASSYSRAPERRGLFQVLRSRSLGRWRGR